MTTKMMVRYGFLLALSVILSYVEYLVEIPILFPGAKLGLANAVGLIVLYYFGIKYFSMFGILRVLLSAILWTGFGSNFFISISGTLLATIMTILVAKYTKASIYGISISGAILHGLGQVIMVAILYQTLYMLTYVVFLIISGIITGYLMALIVASLICRMPKIVN
ncbi:MAG: Gx transporter family protein [Erysipelotrichales bacterium]|nr:Gx transporter family protein [Erysipelotrichales bacterium]